jgi:hypothetical protein
MDSVVSYRSYLNNNLVGADVFLLVPVTPDDWEGPLTLTCGTSGIFTIAFLATFGVHFRVFDDLGTSYDLNVTSRTDNNTVIVQPNIQFPSDMASGFRLYQTQIVVTGLGHMEGEYPAIIADGAVVCSPNNDIDNYPAVQVVGGQLTLPNGIRGAMIHVGRPVVGDVETLDIDTIEQGPTLIESMTINKLYVRVYRSNGLYVHHKFVGNDKINGMEPIDSYDVDYEEDEPIVGNQRKPIKSKRIEVTLPGDWKSQGKIAIRQVDPLHFEILSIIPDAEVHGRGK